MSYVNSTPPSFSSNQKKIVYADDFSCGVVLGGNGKSGAFKKLVNLKCTNNGELCTREVQKKIECETQITGTFHSHTKMPFYGKTVIHAGTSIYSVDAAKNEINLLWDDIADSNSIMVEFLSKLYIYCEYHIFCVDKNFCVTEEQPYAPLVYTKGRIGMSLFQGERDKSVELNLLAPRISVAFNPGITNNWYCSLPVNCDLSREVKVTNAGVEIAKSKYTVKENRVTFNDELDIEKDNDLVITYYTLETEKLGFPDAFSKLTLATAYGGSVISGTRIFATGNPDEPGKYYLSELMDPLRFDQSSYEILGNGSEDITGFARQYGYLIIFTKKSVLRMNYSLTSDGAEFSVKELNNIIGCDCPMTICQIDNRVVFANSKGGVYIIDSTENFDEQNIKPLSGNISRGDGLGLLENTAEDMKNGCAFDFDRKYYLCVGEKMYVWDYNKKTYSDNGNYSSAQSKLVWYIYTDIYAECIFESGNSLCAYSSDADKGVSVFCEGDGNEVYVFADLKSDEYDFSNPYDLKRVMQMRFEVENCIDPQVTLKVYADGQEYYRCTLSKLMRNGERYEVGAHLPYKKLRRFAYGLEFHGKMTIKSAAMIWSSAAR